MKAIIFVKRLNKCGRYISALDYDKTYVDSDNVKGLFKIVVEPVENEIQYKKVEGGYQVLGEGYVITGSTEKEIDKEIRKHHSEKFRDVTMVETDSI